MLSVILNPNFKIKRLLRRCLSILLPLLLLTATALLVIMYQQTATIISNSIHYQLQEINNRSQSRLDSYLAGLDNLLSSTTENPELVTLLLKDDRAAAKQQLQNTLNHNYGEYLDILILTKQNKYWTNMNSPLYLLGHSLKPLINHTPYYNKWSNVELDPSPSPLIALIQRYPILSSHTGQVTGSLFGGLILNDNLSLLSLLGTGIKDTNLQLILKGRPIGPALINTKVRSEVVTYALSADEVTGEVHGHFFSKQPLLINGEPSELSLLLITDNSAFKLQQKNKIYYLLLAFTLVLTLFSGMLMYQIAVRSSNNTQL